VSRRVLLLALVVLALVLAERGVELALDARHVAWLRARGATFAREDGFRLILVGQVALFAGLAVETQLAPWARVGWWTWPLLGLVALAQALRYWVIRTLGPRWSTRVATLPDAPRVTTGPYRFARHPNYAAVAVETVALPLAFGAWATAALASLTMGVALARRIRAEEAAWSEASDEAA